MYPLSLSIYTHHYIHDLHHKTYAKCVLLSHSTVTVTVDDVGQPIPTDHVNKRADSAVTVTATNIPSYADNCVDAAEYRVACSCFGLTASVTTAPAPTVTVTTTVDSCEVL